MKIMRASPLFQAVLLMLYKKLHRICRTLLECVNQSLTQEKAT